MLIGQCDLSCDTSSACDILSRSLTCSIPGADNHVGEDGKVDEAEKCETDALFSIVTKYSKSSVGCWYVSQVCSSIPLVEIGIDCCAWQAPQSVYTVGPLNPGSIVYRLYHYHDPHLLLSPSLFLLPL